MLTMLSSSANSDFLIVSSSTMGSSFVTVFVIVTGFNSTVMGSLTYSTVLVTLITSDILPTLK